MLVPGTREDWLGVLPRRWCGNVLEGCKRMESLRIGEDGLKIFEEICIQNATNYRGTTRLQSRQVEGVDHSKRFKFGVYIQIAIQIVGLDISMINHS